MVIIDKKTGISILKPLSLNKKSKTLAITIPKFIVDKLVIDKDTMIIMKLSEDMKSVTLEKYNGNSSNNVRNDI